MGEIQSHHKGSNSGGFRTEFCPLLIFFLAPLQKKKENAAVKSSPSNLFHAACRRLGPAVLAEIWRGAVGQVHPGERRSSSLYLHVSGRLNNFTEQLQTCYFKGSDTGLLRRNCTWTCCAQKEEKACNFRSTVTVLKAFSGMRNTNFSALSVEKCLFGEVFSIPKDTGLLYGDLRIFLP